MNKYNEHYLKLYLENNGMENILYTLISLLGDKIKEENAPYLEILKNDLEITLNHYQRRNRIV